MKELSLRFRSYHHVELNGKVENDRETGVIEGGGCI